MEGLLIVQNLTLCLQSISNIMSRLTLDSRLPNLRLSQTKTLGPPSLREELNGMTILSQPMFCLDTAEAAHWHLQARRSCLQCI